MAMAITVPTTDKAAVPSERQPNGDRNTIVVNSQSSATKHTHTHTQPNPNPNTHLMNFFGLLGDSRALSVDFSFLIG